MDIAALLIFAGTLIVAAGSPGPSIAALVARVLTRGARNVLPFLTAMWIGEAIWLSLAVWGLSALAQSFQLVFVAIKWAGVAYLLYLAWRMWNARADVDASNTPAKRGAARMFAAGLAVTLGNPKIMVFYMALLPTIIDVATLTVTGWAELTATMVVVLIAIDLAWVFFAARLRLLLKSPAAMRIANRCSAGMMAGAATAIASR
ncbi:LysE family translocator [Rhizobiales bacterium]|uniref:LysE family translocator n=1 Tax=Hongsoonwoonella zoysiae TaxID=2821844 RepID=UPI00155FB5E0|nr:LysE family translocator [Hongsoonwoonella zoysiae]NRG17903.1 LysE family translocator [Hongsoonwoonella zoysiae]